MSTTGSDDRLDRPEMADRTPEPAQQTAAKVAGVLYLLIMAIAIFAEFYARGSLIVPGDAVQTARNIAASERLFRIGIAGNLIMCAGCVMLVGALFVILKPVNRSAALLAAFWRLGECLILAVVTLVDFVALRLLSGAEYLRAFDTQQVQALARVFVAAHADGYGIGMVFFGLGSTAFACLWLKSRYIPRALAAWGIFSSLVVATVALAIMVFPGLVAAVGLFYFAPIFIFEVTLGIWLLVKGLRAPSVEPHIAD
jgi:hypothetical protein